MFQDPTVAGLVRQVTLRRSGGDDFAAVISFHDEGTQTPLFCVHPVTGLSWCYAGLARHLDPQVRSSVSRPTASRNPPG
jgi:enterobactin synthetase component F